MRHYIKRLFIKIYILILSYNKERYEARRISRKNRIIEIKVTKKRLFNDLHIGISLKELEFSKDDLSILYFNPSYDHLIYLSRKYRGFQIGEHPSIYRKSVSRSRY